VALTAGVAQQDTEQKEAMRTSSVHISVLQVATCCFVPGINDSVSHVAWLIRFLQACRLLLFPTDLSKVKIKWLSEHSLVKATNV
jgi:hypothetical protein